MVSSSEELIVLSQRGDGDLPTQSIASEGTRVDTYKQHSIQNNLNWHMDIPVIEFIISN
jgi:hypothetical protein